VCEFVFMDFRVSMDAELVNKKNAASSWVHGLWESRGVTDGWHVENGQKIALSFSFSYF